MTLDQFFPEQPEKPLPHDIEILLEKVRANLTADLLKPEYREKNKTNPMYGHCYVATESIYHLLKSNNYYPHCARDEDGIVHWWLEDQSGQRIDATKDQYTIVNKIPPYEKGRKQWFLTNKPSKRSEKLISKIEV